jgi:hypothetical protein
MGTAPALLEDVPPQASRFGQRCGQHAVVEENVSPPNRRVERATRVRPPEKAVMPSAPYWDWTYV